MLAAVIALDCVWSNANTNTNTKNDWRMKLTVWKESVPPAVWKTLCYCCRRLQLWWELNQPQNLIQMHFFCIHSEIQI